MKHLHLALLVSLFAISTACAATKPPAPGQHSAGNVSVTWERPVTYADGTTLHAQDITGYDVACRFIPTQGAETTCELSKTRLAGGEATSDTLTITVPTAGGQACFRLLTVAATTPTASDPSNESCKELAAVSPSPPSNLRVVQVNVSIIADHALAFLLDGEGHPTGTVAGFARIGAMCYGPPVFTYQSQPFYRVSPVDIAWWGRAPTQNVAAPCA